MQKIEATYSLNFYHENILDIFIIRGLGLKLEENLFGSKKYKWKLQNARRFWIEKLSESKQGNSEEN